MNGQPTVSVKSGEEQLVSRMALFGEKSMDLQALNPKDFAMWELRKTGGSAYFQESSKADITTDLAIIFSTGLSIATVPLTMLGQLFTKFSPLIHALANVA